MTDADAEELKGLIRALEAPAQEGDFAEYNQRDLAFHRKIWELSRNRYIGLALEVIVSRLFTAGLMPREGEQDLRRISRRMDVENHRRILEGLCSGDPEKACDIFWDTFTKAWKETVEIEVKRNFTATELSIPRQSRGL
jgi:DNA-binding GntR family transcriptional regulator